MVLWADANRDPGVMIAHDISHALQQRLGVIAVTVRKANLNK